MTSSFHHKLVEKVRLVCITSAYFLQEEKRVKTKHVLRAGAFQLRLPTHGVLQRVSHCAWQLFLRSGSENCSEPKPGLGFYCPAEELSFLPSFPSLSEQGQAVPACRALAQPRPALLHGSQRPFPLPRCTEPLKGKRFPLATLFARQRIRILQLTELFSGGAGAWGLNTACHPTELCLGEGFRFLLCLELHNTTALATWFCVCRQGGVLIIDCSVPPSPSTY